MKIYFDGGCRPNPGAMEVAAVARGRVYHRRVAEPGTSERAEWLALLHALEVAKSLGVAEAVLLGDSLAVIDQVNGRARRTGGEICGLLSAFEDAAKPLESVRVRYVKRSQNLAGIALDQRRRQSP